MNLKKYLEDIARIDLIPTVNPTSGVLNIKIKFNATVASFAIPNGAFSVGKDGTYKLKLSQILPQLKAVIVKEKPEFKSLLIALDNFPQDSNINVYHDKVEIFFDTNSNVLSFR